MDYLLFNVAITLSMVVGGMFIMLGAMLIFCEEDEDDEGNMMNVLERLDADKVEEILFSDQGDEGMRSMKSMRSPTMSQYGGVETGMGTERSDTAVS
jgi:predicted sugar kinase